MGRPLVVEQACLAVTAVVVVAAVAAAVVVVGPVV